MPSAGWRLLALQSAYGPLASASAARRSLRYAEPRARLLPPRNLDKCMPRPPGAAAPGKMGGGGGGSPGARSGGGFRGEGEGARAAGGWRRRERVARCRESQGADYTRSRDAQRLEQPWRAASSAARLLGPGRSEPSLPWRAAGLALMERF